MMESPWIQTGSGAAFNLVTPDPDTVDFDVDIAEALARIARFTGHIRSGVYSVAQHSVLGADELFRETGRRDLAAYFLLHDAHEAYIGDIATPVADAIAWWTGTYCGQLDPSLSPQRKSQIELYIAQQCWGGQKLLKLAVDRAIHTAAGMPFPLPEDMHRTIKQMDIRMLATERRYLLGPPPRRWHESIEAEKPIRMVGKMTVWPWPDAADAFRDRLRKFIPDLRRPASRRRAA